MPTLTYSQAINDALAEEMRRDENVILYGQDVAKKSGAEFSKSPTGCLKSSVRIACSIRRSPRV